MAPDLHTIIERIHATPHRLVFEFAGAGSLVLWWLHSVAGSSRTIMEATDRYAASSLGALLGAPPATFVSTVTAAAMAQRAYQRALHLRTDDSLVLGLACTATIATDRAKRGEHRCVVAVQNADTTTTYALTLTKGLRDRVGEETLVSQVVLHGLVRACGLDVAVPLGLATGETLHEEGMRERTT